MDIESRLSISFYKTIATINENHRIYIVQNINTSKIYVKKIMSIYNKELYEKLKIAPIPHTPRVYELYEENNELTVIEEYVSGDTLEELLDKETVFDDNTIQRIFVLLCETVIKFHRFEPAVIHRDIKPSNVILTPSGEVYLLDFNAAKYSSTDKEEDTTLLGTKGYAAPEQYGFGVSTIQTDIYALGMLLNTLVNGHFSQTVNPNSKFASVISNCIKLKPEERYPNVEAILKALKVYEPLHGSGDDLSHSWRRFLPPGFKKLSPIMIPAALGYYLIFYVCLSFTAENVYGIQLYLERFITLIFMLGLVFCSCNYLNVQSLLPMCRSPKPLKRFLGVILLDLIVFCVFVFAVIIISTIYT